MKKILIFLIFSAIHLSMTAQIIVTTSNPNAWQLSRDNNCHVNPLTMAQLNGLAGWMQVAQACANPTFANSISDNPCNQQDNLTKYFRTTFTINPGVNICQAYYYATADNFFRIYVNGNLVQGSFAGNTNCSNLQNWNGNDWTSGFSGSFTNFVVTGLNTIIVEVQNGVSTGNHPEWFAGNFTLWSTTDLDASFGHTLSPIGQTNNDALTLWATGLGLMQDWVVETGSSSNGPWSPYYSSYNKRIVLDEMLVVPHCVWIRVTHTVRIGSCSVSSTLIFNQCGKHMNDINSNELPGHILLTDEELLSLSGTSSVYPIEFNNYPEDSILVISSSIQKSLNSVEKNFKPEIVVYPNPSTGNIKISINNSGESIYKVTIVRSDGQIIKECDNLNEVNNIEFTDLPQGLLFVKVLDKNDGVISTAKMLIVP